MLDNVQVTRLANGCQVATSTLPWVDSLAVGFFAHVGSRYESAKQSGHSHFLEHMLFKGSAKRSARAISQAIEGRGGNMNAYTNLESTAYYAVVPADAAQLTIDVLGDMYVNPKLAEVDVDKERTVILEEVNMYHDQPDAHVFDLAQQSLWTKHPLGNPVLGFENALRATTSDSLRAYHSYHYNAGSTVIVAAGNITHDAFLDYVQPYAEQLPSGKLRAFKGVTAKTKSTQVLFDQRETEQVQAVLSFRALGRNDPRRYALNMLNIILGGNMSSRLFQVVREKHGMAYSVSSSPTFYADTGDLQIYAGLDRQRSVKGLVLCVQEALRMALQCVPKAEFERARQYMLGSLKLGLETPRSHMSWIGNGVLNARLRTPAEAFEFIQSVTQEDVRMIAQQIFTPDNMTLTLVLPRTDVSTPEMHDAAIRAVWK